MMTYRLQKEKISWSLKIVTDFYCSSNILKHNFKQKLYLHFHQYDDKIIYFMTYIYNYSKSYFNIFKRQKCLNLDSFSKNVIIYFIPFTKYCDS